MMLKIKIVLLIVFCSFFQAAAKPYPGIVKLVTGTHWTITTTTDNGKLVSSKSNIVRFSFYQEAHSSRVKRRLSFYHDAINTPKEKIMEKDYHSWLRPMCFNDDTVNGYFDLYFVCKSKKRRWLEVIVDEGTQETLWIKNKRFVNFLTWNKLYKKEHFTCVKPKLKLYEKRDTSSAAISSFPTDYYEIMEVKNNWMKIKTGEGDNCINNSDKVITGWINYRSKENLFIDVIIH